MAALYIAAFFRCDQMGSLDLGLVLKIERGSIYDGPGLRTVVFLKGCPLRCKWCSTPESQSYRLEKGYRAKYCILCGKCAAACTQGAICLAEDKLKLNSQLCIGSLNCVRACPRGALEVYGNLMSVDEVMQVVLKDEVFFFHSGGGVTISGGEVLLQSDFSRGILKAARGLGINTAVETSLYGDYSQVDKILPWVDFLYVDLKHMDSDQHLKWTGVDNVSVLDNVKKADASVYQFDLYLRIPLIPGVNDDDDNLAAAAAFSSQLAKLAAIEILPYHRLGVKTYQKLGREYELKDLRPPTHAHVMERVSYLAQLVPTIKVGAGGGDYIN